MSEAFKFGTGTKTEPVKEGNVNPEAVEPKVDGEESSKPVVVEDDKADKPEDRKYSASDLEQIVKERLARERKKFDREKSEWENKHTVPKPASTNVEEDLRSKLATYENDKKQLNEKLTKYQQDNLRSHIEKTLNAANCLDPEVVIDHFISKNLVHLDDDGEMVVENTTANLDDLVQDYLSKKPYLLKATATNGVGSKAPKRPVTSNGTVKEMTTDQIREQLGGNKAVKKNPFSR
jgi:hypothetical protein